MLVQVSGQLSWHLTASDGNGPEIPGMAAVLLALRMAGSGPAASGAFACMGLLKLEAFEGEFGWWGLLLRL